jgi:glutathione S-transferase
MADLTLVIGDKRLSSWSFRPWLALKTADIAFEEVTIHLGWPDTAERIRAYSPAGRVPVLAGDGATVWESLAICEWAVERFPETRLWPADDAARAHARAISHEMHAGFAGLRETLPFDAARSRPRPPPTPEVEHEIERIVAIWDDCRRRYDGAAKDEGLLFGGFTIADAMYAPVVSRFLTYGIDVEGPAGDYARAVAALPAFVEWHADARGS